MSTSGTEKTSSTSYLGEYSGPEMGPWPHVGRVDQFGDRIYRDEIGAPEISPEDFLGEDYYYYCPEEEDTKEEEGEVFEKDPRASRKLSRKFSKRISIYAPLRKAKEKKKAEVRTKKLFVHTSPLNFPDMAKASKSAFSTTFLRSTGDVAEDIALMRTLTESSFATLQSFFSSFDRILSAPFTDLNRRHLPTMYKESMLRKLEMHGVTRVNSEGGVQWNLYPITQSYLFSIQIGDHVHQTRVLSRIEDRILTGHVQRMRLPFAWPTESVWTGHWDAAGMAGSGTYTMPHGVIYQGKMLDGMFHDSNATLTYPNQVKAINCIYEKGKLLSCQFQFPDSLIYSSSNPEEWDYCRFPDRRFWSEVQKGLKPAKISQKTEVDPPRRIAPGCYDTSDGFYDPKTLMLLSPYGELLRVPTCDEEIWIKHFCRKGFFEPADFRPDLFENWFNFDKELIQMILTQQANYRTGKISFNDLQQFYADFGMLPPWSTFKRRRISREIEIENFVKSIPSPKTLGVKSIRKFKGHKILGGSVASSRSSQSSHSEKLKTGVAKESKSLLKFTEDSNLKFGTPLGLGPKSSKISFKLMQDPQEPKDDPLSRATWGSEKRTIPEKFLQYRPLLKPPFRDTPIAPSNSPTGSRMRCSTRPRPAGADRLPRNTRTSIRRKTASESWERDQVRSFARALIWGLINDILLAERDRHIKRLRWAQNQALKINDYKRVKSVISTKCIKVLEQLFDSISEKEEFCDSDPSRICDLRKLAQDKYRVLQYWGTRMFTLNFERKETKS